MAAIALEMRPLEWFAIVLERITRNFWVSTYSTKQGAQWRLRGISAEQHAWVGNKAECENRTIANGCCATSASLYSTFRTITLRTVLDTLDRPWCQGVVCISQQSLKRDIRRKSVWACDTENYIQNDAVIKDNMTRPSTGRWIAIGRAAVIGTSFANRIQVFLTHKS